MIDWCETLDPFPASALEREMRASSAWLASALVLGWDPVVLKARSNDRSSRPLFMRGTGNLCTADAKRMAEPEDQDFYGIGSRSARFTISLLVLIEVVFLLQIRHLAVPRCVYHPH